MTTKTIGKGAKTVLLETDSADTTGSNTGIMPGSRHKSIQATLDASGTAAEVEVIGSNDGVAWVVIGTLTCAGNLGTDALYSEAPFYFINARTTSTTVTGTVTVTMSL